MTRADFVFAAGGGGVTWWNLSNLSEISQWVGVIVGVLTAFVLIQRIAYNCREWRRTQSAKADK